MVGSGYRRKFTSANQKAQCQLGNVSLNRVADPNPAIRQQWWNRPVPRGIWQIRPPAAVRDKNKPLWRKRWWCDKTDRKKQGKTPPINTKKWEREDDERLPIVRQREGNPTLQKVRQRKETAKRLKWEDTNTWERFKESSREDPIPIKSRRREL